MASPRYEHDCDRCVLLGRQEDNDVYYCTQGGSLPTVIFRFGSDGPDYRSGWHLRRELTPALRRRLREIHDD